MPVLGLAAAPPTDRPRTRRHQSWREGIPSRHPDPCRPGRRSPCWDHPARWLFETGNAADNEHRARVLAVGHEIVRRTLKLGDGRVFSPCVACGRNRIRCGEINEFGVDRADLVSAVRLREDVEAIVGRKWILLKTALAPLVVRAVAARVAPSRRRDHWDRRCRRA